MASIAPLDLGSAKYSAQQQNGTEVAQNNTPPAPGQTQQPSQSQQPVQGQPSQQQQPNAQQPQGQQSTIESAVEKKVSSGMNQLKPAMEAEEKVVFWITNRILIPGAMVVSGGVVAFGGAVATVGVCATVAGCLASPITVGVAASGVGLAAEGVHYGITGKMWIPSSLQQ